MPIFKSGQIYSQIYEPRQDLKVHNTLLWCRFRLRLQLKRDLHLWEDTCKQGPNHASGELPQICKDLHPIQICKDIHPTQICKDLHPTQICKDLHPTQIYKTQHLTGSTPKHPVLKPRASSHSIPNGNLVTPQCNTFFSSRGGVLPQMALFQCIQQCVSLLTPGTQEKDFHVAISVQIGDMK